VQFDDVRARLTKIPASLPIAPAALMPAVLPQADGSMPQVPDWPTGRRQAAVLVLIHPDPATGAAQVVLVERSAGDHRHAGQISFPGGALEEGESAVEAALREAAEEVGLDAAAEGVTVAGVLPMVDVRVSGFLVEQVIAFCNRPPKLTPDGHEVAAAFSAPVAAFLPGAAIETVTDERDGFRLRYGAYRIGQRLVWGATAGMLGRLGAFLAGGAEQPGVSRGR
jgi:8-oxo-dGTP pyrophosphatase MutT (NUDIX family)